MKRIRKFLLGIGLFGLLLSGCSSIQSTSGANTKSNQATNSNDSSSYSRIRDTYYQVIWQNWDLTTLETDYYVKEGTVPIYKGPTPTKKENGIEYSFVGWDPEPSPIYKDTTYVAVFSNSITSGDISFDYEQVEGGYKLTITAKESATLKYEDSRKIKHQDELVEVYVGRNITVVDHLEFDSSAMKKLTFSSDVTSINRLFITNEVLDGIYFEGNEPTINLIGRYNGPLGKSYLPFIYYNPATKGWDEYAISGCVLKDITAPAPTLPDISLQEWSRQMVTQANKRVENIYKDMVTNHEESLFLVPTNNDTEGNPIIKQFAEGLIEGKTTNIEKIDAIYDWVRKNIKYDIGATNATSYQAFKNKRGVCAQYTNLMRDMLTFVGIFSYAVQCTVVDSPVTGIQDLIRNPYDEDLADYAHILLAVYENDEVMYYDPTWSNRYGTNYDKVAQNYYINRINYVTIVPDGFDMSLLQYGYMPCVAWASDTEMYVFEGGHISTTGGCEFMSNWIFPIAFYTCQDLYGFPGYHYYEIFRSNFSHRFNVFNGVYSRCDGISINVFTLYLYFNEVQPDLLPSLLAKHDITNVNIYSDFVVVDGALSYFSGKDKNVTIPHRVDDMDIYRIEEFAFSDNDYIENVVLEEGIQEIAVHAFYNCQNLKTVTIPSTAGEHFDVSMFPETYDNGLTYNPVECCFNFEQFVVPNNNQKFKTINGNLYTKDGKFLLSVAPKSTNITLEGVKNIANFAVSHSCIESIAIPSSIETIGDSAFSYCENLKTVTYPQTANIKEYGCTFICCPSLREVHFPNNLKEIVGMAFSSCLSLADVHLPDSLEKIGDWAFVDSGLVHINLPANLETIGEDAFMGCKKLFDVDNYSSFNLEIGSKEYGCVAEHTKDVSQTSYTKNVDNFIFYVNGNTKILMSYVGDAENESLTLPAGVDGDIYTINKYFFLYGEKYAVNTSAGTRSIVEFTLYNEFNKIKTLYIPSGISRSGMQLPKDVSVVVI